jgi:signal transduction histidine kinase
VVEVHGGLIRLDDTYHDGARFVFTLPRTPAGAQAADVAQDALAAG